LNEFKNDNNKATAQFFNYISTTLVNDPKQVEELIGVALNPSTKSTSGASLLGGIFNQWSKKGIKTNLSESLKNQLLSTFNETTYPSVRNASLRLLSLSGLPVLPKNYLNSSVLPIAKSINSAEDFRADAVYFLTFANKIFNKEQFQTFANSKESEKVQLAALEMMNNKTADKLPCQYILSDWKQRSSEVQNKAIDLFLKRTEWSHLLLDAIAKGIVTHEQLGWRRTSRLMGIDDLALRAKAREVLAKEGMAREAIFASYQPCLNLIGNPQNGKKVFETACATCHKINDIGIDFGPELGSLRNRPVNNILESIIMPNKTIADMYETWHVELKNGKTLEGIITDRTSSSYTLKMMGGQEQIITKKEVKNMKALSTSSMPEGLENAISLTEMADLLAFIKGLK
jgi:putative heme-binding domain-containing protein